MRVAIAALDPKARLVATREQEVEFTSTESTPGARHAYEVLSRLELAPGQYEIRVAADASTGERGSVFTFVDVPDFLNARFTVSGVSVSAHPAVPAAPQGLFADLMPADPTVRREFARSDEATAFMRMQQAAAAPADVTVLSRILDGAGRVVLEDTRSFAAAEFTGGRGVDYQLTLPLERLETDDYLLAIQATTASAELRRNVRFTAR